MEHQDVNAFGSRQQQQQQQQQPSPLQLQSHPHRLFLGDDGPTTTSTQCCIPPSHETQQGNNKNSSNNDEDMNYMQAVNTISEALGKLSMAQREEAYEDIHGIVHGTSKVQEEDPEMVAQCLLDMDRELSNAVAAISKSHHPHHRSSSDSTTKQHTAPTTSTTICAYKEAQLSSPSYVQDPEFRLMFLRANVWDPKLSAKRLIDFMEQKLQLFGHDKLGRDIQLKDIMENEMDRKFLESGHIQIVPLQDRSGRHILVLNPRFPECFTVQNMLRTFYYLLMSVVQGNVQAQRLGLVEIVHQLSFSMIRNDKRGMFGQGIGVLRDLLPLRAAAIHCCTNDPAVNFLVSTANLLFSKYVISRIQVHRGGFMEALYALMSFGIPVGALPMLPSGEWTTKYHQTWLEKQRKLETIAIIRAGDREDAMDTKPSAQPVLSSWTTGVAEPLLIDMIPLSSDDNKCDEEQQHERGSSSSAATATAKPEPSDVVVGSGRIIDNRPGNVQFRRVLVEHMEQYEKASKFQKTSISERLMQHFKRINVRFLTQVSAVSEDDNPEWVEADDKTVREKISRTFRRIRKAQRGSSAEDLDNDDNHSAENFAAGSAAARKGSGNGPDEVPSSAANLVLIDHPLSTDIILGRGKSIYSRPANSQFRHLLGQHLERYDQAPNFKKTEMADQIMHSLRDANVRFLKPLGPSQTGWIEADDKTIREKIGRTFRVIRESKRGGGFGDG